MKILFFGDSITDGGRDRSYQDNAVATYGMGTGYVNAVASELAYHAPNEYQFVNAGVAGDTSLQLLVRIKKDCWNYQPDVISLFVGVNDVFQGIYNENGTGIERFERVYRMMLEDTQRELPNVKIMLLEPFIQKGSITEAHFDYAYQEVRRFAEVVQNLAKEYRLPFVALQTALNEYAEKYRTETVLIDGIHPSIFGARVIADEWLKVFRGQIIG